MSKVKEEKVKFSLKLGETISAGDNRFEFIRVDWGEEVGFDSAILPKDYTVNDAKEMFIEQVKAEFAKRRADAIQDFIDNNGR